MKVVWFSHYSRNVMLTSHGLVKPLC